MSMGYWRRETRKVILATLAALPVDATLAEKRRALRDAYPFGLRQHHPYKIWFDEVNVQLGLKKSKARQIADASEAPLFDGEAAR